MELLGRHCNQPQSLTRLSKIRDLPTRVGGPKVIAHPNRSKRLNDTECKEIAQAYRAGETVNVLAKRYDTTRQTISTALEREGVPRRYNLLSAHGAERAAVLYRDGQSLAVVAEQLGVSTRTIRAALVRTGVAMRPVGTNQWTRDP